MTEPWTRRRFVFACTAWSLLLLYPVSGLAQDADPAVARIRAFYDALTRSGHGRFVIMSAKQAVMPTTDNAAYAAAKAAAEAWTLALADELAGTGATANILVVNAILTARMQAENPGKEYPSFTHADDLAAAIAFVLGDHAARMNGKRIRLHP